MKQIINTHTYLQTHKHTHTCTHTHIHTHTHTHTRTHTHTQMTLSPNTQTHTHTHTERRNFKYGSFLGDMCSSMNSVVFRRITGTRKSRRTQLKLLQTHTYIYVHKTTHCQSHTHNRISNARTHKYIIHTHTHKYKTQTHTHIHKRTRPTVHKVR